MKKYINDVNDIEVDAIQVTLENYPQILEDLGAEAISIQRVLFDISILTPDGRVKAEFQDWIVKDTDGQYYALKRRSFEKAFKEVEEKKEEEDND